MKYFLVTDPFYALIKVLDGDSVQDICREFMGELFEEVIWGDSFAYTDLDRDQALVFYARLYDPEYFGEDEFDVDLAIDEFNEEISCVLIASMLDMEDEE